jgi:molybdopterin-guanine dinucleotide biosynthesis protein A
LLEKFLKEGGRKIDLFSKKIKTRVVNFPFIGYDPFFNVNNLDDLIKAEGIFKKLGGTNL